MESSRSARAAITHSCAPTGDDVPYFARNLVTMAIIHVVNDQSPAHWLDPISFVPSTLQSSGFSAGTTRSLKVAGYTPVALATANGTERNRLVRDQLFPVDFYKQLVVH